MGRRPFTPIPIPTGTTGAALVQAVMKMLRDVQGAAPRGPSNRALTGTTQLQDGVADEYTLVRCDATAGAFAVTLPASVTSQDTVLTLKKVDATANVVTVSPKGTDTIEGAASLSLGTQWKAYTLQARSGGWDVLTAPVTSSAATTPSLARTFALMGA